MNWTAYRPLIRRGFSSTSNNGQIPKLSDQLRKLYLKVHPDFVPSERFPNEHRTNQRSFALLNSLLSALRNGKNWDEGSARKVREIKFFVKKRVHVEPNSNSGSHTDEFEQHSVNIRLFDGNTKNSHTRNQIRTFLSDLFGKCGLDKDFAWDDFLKNAGYHHDIDSSSSFRPSSFSTDESFPFHFSSLFELRQKSKGRPNLQSLSDFARFLQHCHVQSMNLKDQNSSLSIRTRSILSELRTSGFRLIIENENAMSLSEQFRIASLFKEAFSEHEMSHLFKQSVIFFLSSKPTHVDNLGRICLSLLDSSEAWISFVSSLISKDKLTEPLLHRSVEGVSDRKDLLSLKAFEDEISESLGVFDVYCEHSVIQRNVSEYRLLLQSFLQNKEKFHSLKCDEISLVVTMNPTITHHSDLGLVLVPINASILSIVEYLENYGTLIANEKAYATKHKMVLNGIISRTKRHLQVASLNRDESKVSLAEYVHCCRNLCSLPLSEAQCLNGVALVISDHMEFQDIGLMGRAKIHWDWLKDNF